MTIYDNGRGSHGDEAVDSDANDAQEAHTRGTHIDMHPYCPLLGVFVLGFEVKVPVRGQVGCRLARGLTRRSIEDREAHTEMPVQMQVQVHMQVP